MNYFFYVACAIFIACMDFLLYSCSLLPLVRWFFLHSFINIVIVAVAFPGFLTFISDPLNATSHLDFYASNNVPLIISCKNRVFSALVNLAPSSKMRVNNESLWSKTGVAILSWCVLRASQNSDCVLDTS